MYVVEHRRKTFIKEFRKKTCTWPGQYINKNSNELNMFVDEDWLRAKRSKVVVKLVVIEVLCGTYVVVSGVSSRNSSR